MSCRPFCVMLASMPAGTNSTVAIEGKQLLLTIGPAGVLSRRAIAAEDAVALWRLLGPPHERHRRDFKRLTDIVLIENGATIYWPRTGEVFPLADATPERLPGAASRQSPQACVSSSASDPSSFRPESHYIRVDHLDGGGSKGTE